MKDDGFRTYKTTININRNKRWDEPDEWTDYEITVSANMNGIAALLAGKAARNKSGKSRYLNGQIEVEAKKVKS